MPKSLPRSIGLATLAACLGLAAAGPSSAIDFLDGRVQVHGYGEMQLRTISDGYRRDGFYLSQWANVLNIETDLDLFPNGIGPFSSVSGYVRLEARYDCVWTKVCGLAPNYVYFGDRATRAPAANWANGKATGFVGALDYKKPERIQDDNNHLIHFFDIPPLRDLTALAGNTDAIEATFAPTGNPFFTTKLMHGSQDFELAVLGPWRPESKIVAVGSLASVSDPTFPDLPFRPLIPDVKTEPGGAQGLYIPSAAMRERRDAFGPFDQNFSQDQLAWNHGASQEQTRELKEAYLDLEMLDGRLWFRVGKQTIIWGKTELFRGTDTFNPQDFGLSSLPSLEESRIALWAVRGVYSFYDVGPLEDVRLEVAANFDRFQPADFGKCGEPYAVWLVCLKTAGLFAHGTLGVGLAGETRPPDPWKDARGLEFGERVEFRWDRFSFALTDFWGYSDFPIAKNFYTYQRSVDVNTGRPLDVKGNVLDPATDPNIRQHVLAGETLNRQFYDVLCSATKGLATAIFPALQNACLLDLLNDPTPITLGLTPATVFAEIITGNATGNFLLGQVATGGGMFPPPAGGLPPLVELNKDGNDGPGAGFFGPNSLAAYLTVQQQALLGCGAYYGTRCDIEGADLFNTEASVLLQAFPFFEKGGPVATRFANGKLVVLPGARSIDNPLYDPRIDGCVAPGIDGLAPAGFCSGAHDLLSLGFKSEMAALSSNALSLVATLGSVGGKDPKCVPTNPATCLFVQGLFSATGVKRPEIRSGGNGRFGRRDFIWQGGSEIQLQYQKRNVLGFAADWAEDVTKTNWSTEFTWSSAEAYADEMDPRGYSAHDTFGLTVSVDRPTFINFLNANRTFLFNAQVFFRWIDGYSGRGRFDVNGPLNVLGTFTIVTGYFQDRLQPALTLVYDYYSASGGLLPSVQYRFTENFSATLGMAMFWGNPDHRRLPVNEPILLNQGGDFRARDNYQILSALAERDEISLVLRYTF